MIPSLPVPPPPSPDTPVMYIHKDSTEENSGIILTAECKKGYAPYSYLWIPVADGNYYPKLMVFLKQKCIVDSKGKKK